MQPESDREEWNRWREEQWRQDDRDAAIWSAISSLSSRS